MITTDQAQQLISGNGHVIGQDGDKIGDIGQIFLDDQTGEPDWVTTKTGMFGGAESFVPLQRAEIDGNDVRVPYDKATVKDAPRISDADGHLSEQEESTLFAHYGLGDTYAAGTDTSRDNRDGDAYAGTTQRQGDHDRDATVGHDTSGPTTDSAMTRSEEQLHVGTESRETGRARLRKFVVTENVTTTVPVSREEVRVDREPITADNMGDAVSGGDLTSEEHEVILHEERPVVSKETVPVERVKVDTDTVVGEERVDEEVRKEQIELDDDSTTTDSTTRRGEDNRG